MEEKNLLIIDDETLLLENLNVLLKKHASTIFLASNAMEGLRILNTQNIHCVICDISMPGMTGVELIKQIRSEGNEVPFIFYTAFGNHELMREAAKYGAFDFLTKPIFEDLQSVVSRGLTEGFQRVNRQNCPDLESEYQQILEEFLREDSEKS